MRAHLDSLVRLTEQLLTWRARRNHRRRERQKKKNVVVDWLEAFVWAAFVVLLINQYLLQAYQIPSGSMIRTLLLGDRIFVNKLVYGPEMIPGIGKIPGIREPQRNDIVIFENPSYIGKGPLFDIAQRVIYMLTLSLVDIDKDEFGMPRAHFLIKRAVGVGGDRWRVRRGEMEIRPRGEERWLTEAEFRRLAGIEYETQRLLRESDYETIEAAADPAAGTEELSRMQNLRYGDPFAFERTRQTATLALSPDNENARRRMQYVRVGWYVPDTRILPLGDNRDNSRDGRYFGPVRLRHVLGKAMVIYWPVARWGAVR